MQKCCAAPNNQSSNVQKTRFRTSFFYKVLLSLKILQDESGTNQGIKLCDIARYMESAYCLSGDVYSQVLSSISSAEDFHFVIRKKDKYVLTTPAATIQLAPNPCRKIEIERIQGIFSIASGPDCPSSCENTKAIRKKRKRPNRSRGRAAGARQGRSRSRSRSTSRSRSRSKSSSGSRSRSRSRSKSPSDSRSPSSSPENCRCPVSKERKSGILRNAQSKTNAEKKSSENKQNGKKKVKLEEDDDCLNLRTRKVPNNLVKKNPSKSKQCAQNKCSDSESESSDVC